MSLLAGAWLFSLRFFSEAWVCRLCFSRGRQVAGAFKIRRRPPHLRSCRGSPPGVLGQPFAPLESTSGFGRASVGRTEIGDL